MNSKFNVVMIDDQKDFLEAFRSGLQDQFNVNTFTRAREALMFLDRHPVDAVVLDYHMPDVTAWNIYEELQAKDFTRPVILLTGETDMSVKLEGLERGVDDFLHKPISPSELSARLRNRIRNFRRRNPQVMKVKNLEINMTDPQIHLNGVPVILTNKEFEILRLLVLNQNSVVTKSKILEKIWANVTVEKNNIDTHMSNLRKKLTGLECQIRTIKKIGYVLGVPV
jgi:two-component system phosphate regulon response regulator PhoB